MSMCVCVFMRVGVYGAMWLCVSISCVCAHVFVCVCDRVRMSCVYRVACVRVYVCTSLRGNTCTCLGCHVFM